MIRALYSLLLHLAIPFVLLRLKRRARKEPEYGKHIAERFGRGTLRLDASQTSLWIHAVSVGEVRAALPLIGKLRGTHEGVPIVVSVMTPTGRATARQILPDDVHVVYLPYDLPWAMRAFITQIRPRLLIVMETEVWPNMLATCVDRGIPRLLVNARLSEKSLQGYQRNFFVRALARDAFAAFDRVLAQSQSDATRLASVGAKNVIVTGNVKFDLTVNAELIAQGRAWKEAVGDRPVVLLASTREREEKLLVEAFQKMQWSPDPRASAPLLVVVPRHPARFDDVCAILENARMIVGRRSTGSPPSPQFSAWLGDSMGEMQAYYAMADVAIIGGSFEPLGGQNLIEAAAIGAPIVMGPSTFNFSEAVVLASEAGAMANVSDPLAAMEAAQKLLGKDAARNAMRDAAKAFAQAHGGATARTMDEIERVLTK
jgi:3-deoxy-D-manno-octulosonic-acid transferase